MKVLLDECVDWRLARDVAGHDVKTTHHMGWKTKKDGELLRLASESFDVFVTVDRNLRFQQKVEYLPLAVIVLRGKTNRLADLRGLIPLLVGAIETATPGSVKVIGDGRT